MRRILIVLAVLLLLAGIAFALGPGPQLWRLFNPPQQDLPLPAALVDVHSPEGQRLLSAGVVADHGMLSAAYRPQQYGSYCGVASSVIALTALGVTTSQDDFFTPAAAEVREKNAVLFGGMNLDALGGLLSAHGVTAQVHHAADTTLDDFRRLATDNLARTGDVVLVNYHRPVLEQEGGGHISPLAAYEADSDRFLILDTAQYKYPPVWVEAEALWASMSTTDSDGGRSRGFVLIGPAR